MYGYERGASDDPVCAIFAWFGHSETSRFLISDSLWKCSAWSVVRCADDMEPEWKQNFPPT